MKKSKPKTRATKKSTAPSKGAGTPMVVRMQKNQIAALDAWIRDAKISRPEAIRQLVSWALTQHS
jgi:hypothetical protein